MKFFQKNGAFFSGNKYDLKNMQRKAHFQKIFKKLPKVAYRAPTLYFSQKIFQKSFLIFVVYFSSFVTELWDTQGDLNSFSSTEIGTALDDWDYGGAFVIPSNMCPST